MTKVDEQFAKRMDNILASFYMMNVRLYLINMFLKEFYARKN